jgi:hypothetical protein
MTVEELIKQLKFLPQEATVIMSSDSEGNSYSEIEDSISNGTWNPETQELETFPFTPNECFTVKAVILYPTR